MSISGLVKNNLGYADDTTFLAYTKEDKENLLSRLECVLVIDREKMKMMIVDRAEQNKPDIRSIANYHVILNDIYFGFKYNYLTKGAASRRSKDDA